MLHVICVRVCVLSVRTYTRFYAPWRPLNLVFSYLVETESSCPFVCTENRLEPERSVQRNY